jgi:hypothetical protein
MHHWVIKLRDSGRNLDLKDQQHSGGPVAAAYDLNRQNFDKLIQEIKENQLQDLLEDPREAEKRNQSCL